jgi:hypothetical protein
LDFSFPFALDIEDIEELFSGESCIGGNGLTNTGDNGLIGLIGIDCRPDTPDCKSAWIYLDQSPKPYCDSSAVRNHSVVGPESLVVVNPAVLLDRRFLNLSVVASGHIWMARVGRTWPGFR